MLVKLKQFMDTATLNAGVESLRLAEEKTALLKQCEDSVLVKMEEAEQLKLKFEEAQQELQLTKNQVCLKILKKVS